MLERGVRLVEILKQGQYVPLPVEKQIVIVYAGTKGYLDELPVAKLARVRGGALRLHRVRSTPTSSRPSAPKKKLDDVEDKLKKALTEFGKAFGKRELTDAVAQRRFASGSGASSRRRRSRAP
jgi:F-type H+-transporting ATPase subunit alpha